LTLVHGGWGDSDAWRGVLPGLEQTFRVLTYDARGYGETDQPSETWLVADWAADLRGLWDQLGVARSWLLGFSMGGLIALDVVSTDPDRVAGLLLVSTTCRFTDAARERFRANVPGFDATRYDAALERHLGAAFAPSFREANPGFLEDYGARARRATSVATVRNTMIALDEADYREELAGIECPTLIVNGSEDPVTGEEHAAALHAGIQGSERRVIDGGGHSLHLERPDTFVELVTEFVQGAETRVAEAG
jgi:pimeloyl-ACP methyl ester carboxylesterase